MCKLSNDEIYQELMELRRINRKRYACLRIAEAYDYLKSRLTERAKIENGEITSKKKSPISDEEIEALKDRIKELTSRMVRIYGLTQADIDRYNSYAVGKLKIAIA